MMDETQDYDRYLDLSEESEFADQHSIAEYTSIFNFDQTGVDILEFTGTMEDETSKEVAYKEIEKENEANTTNSDDQW